MKIQELRTQTITYAGIKGAIVVGVMVLLLVALGIRNNEEDALTKANARARDVNASIQSTEQFLEKAQKSLELQATLQHKNKLSGSGIDQKYIANLLNALKERYLLTELSMKMTPPTVLKDGEFAKTHIELEHTLVTLTFAGLSDELLLSFVDNMLRLLPGYTQVDVVQLERRKPIDKAFLDEVAREKYTPIVGGVLSLHWIALKPKPQAPPASGAPHAP
jgi:hypothetical protein